YTIPGILANSNPFTSDHFATLIRHDTSIELVFWDISSPQQAQELARVAIPVPSARLDRLEVSLNFHYIVTGDHDHQFRLWDASTGQEIAVPTLQQPCAAGVDPVFSPDSARLAVCNASGQLVVLDVVTHTELYRLPASSAFTFSFDGATLLT